MRTKIYSLFLGMAAFIMILMLVPTNQGFSAIEVQAKPNKANFTPTIKIGGLIQTWFESTLHNLDNDTENAQENTNNFYVRRLRLKVTGEVVKNVKFHFQLQGDSPDTVGIRKAWVNLTHFSFANIMFGVIDLPFNYQFTFMGGGGQLLTDRANANTKPGVRTDVGVQLHGGFMKKRIRYFLALSRGSVNSKGSSQARNAGLGKGRGDTTMMVSGRLQYDHLGKGFKNAWFKKDLDFHIGGGFFYTKQSLNAGDKGTQDPKISSATGITDIFGVSAEAGVNWNIIYLLGGFQYISGKDRATGADLVPFTGIYVDLGVTILPKYLVGNARLDIYNDSVLPTKSAGDADSHRAKKVTAIEIGFAWYVGGNKHALKIQPAVLFELDRRSRAGQNEVKRSAVRLAATVNF